MHMFFFVACAYDNVDLAVTFPQLACLLVAGFGLRNRLGDIMANISGA